MTKQLYGASKFRRAFIHFITGRVVQMVARAFLLLLLIRLLELGDYGAYMLLVGLSEMMLQVVSFGILPVGQRYLPQMITSLPAAKLFRFVLTITALQLGVLCVTIAILSEFWTAVTQLSGFSTDQISDTRVAVLLFLLVPAFRFAGELLEALLEQGRAQLARALMPIGRIIGIGLLMIFGTRIELSTILMVDVAVTAICLLLAYILLIQSLLSLHTSDGDGEIPLREMIRFAWHMAAVDLLGSTGSPGAIRFILANTLGVVESGMFAFIQSLQRLVGRYLPGTLLRGLIRPVLVSRAFTPGGMTQVAAGAGLLLKSNLLIVAASAVIVAVGGDDLINLVSGGKFPNAGLTLLLMLLALTFSSQRAVIEMIMQITGHTSTLRATALIAPASLFAMWLLADQGLNMVILIIAGGAALSNGIAMAVLIRSIDEFNVDWRGLLSTVVPAILAIIMGVILHAVTSPIEAAMIALVLFMGLLLITKPFTRLELTIIEWGAGKRMTKLFQAFSNNRTG